MRTRERAGSLPNDPRGHRRCRRLRSPACRSSRTEKLTAGRPRGSRRLSQEMSCRFAAERRHTVRGRSRAAAWRGSHVVRGSCSRDRRRRRWGGRPGRCRPRRRGRAPASPRGRGGAWPGRRSGHGADGRPGRHRRSRRRSSRRGGTAAAVATGAAGMVAVGPVDVEQEQPIDDRAAARSGNHHGDKTEAE